jgi:hypothetical protein
MTRLEFFKNIWNDGIKGKAMLIFAGVVLVGAVFGVIYGVGFQ